jgi:hypothetical protein
MRTTVRIIICSAVALMSAAQATAGISQLHRGLWQIEWREERPEGAEPEDRRVRKRCVTQTADLVYEFLGPTSASSGSTLIRAALDDRRTVIDHLEQHGRYYVTTRSPWMLGTADYGRLTTGVSVVSKVDGLGVRFGYRSRTWWLENGVPTAPTPASKLVVIEGRRVGDCSSGFRFMTLREIWRSIFQWGF